VYSEDARWRWRSAHADDRGQDGARRRAVDPLHGNGNTDTELGRRLGHVLVGFYEFIPTWMAKFRRTYRDAASESSRKHDPLKPQLQPLSCATNDSCNASLVLLNMADALQRGLYICQTTRRFLIYRERQWRVCARIKRYFSWVGRWSGRVVLSDEVTSARNGPRKVIIAHIDNTV
jgi:hypothetical protein